MLGQPRRTQRRARKVASDEGALRGEGWGVNHKRVARLMKLEGLEGASRRRKWRTTKRAKDVTADLQKGFRVLSDANLLDMTFEALVVRHSSLFRASVVEAADWRLKNPHYLLSP